MMAHEMSLRRGDQLSKKSEIQNKHLYTHLANNYTTPQEVSNQYAFWCGLVVANVNLPIFMRITSLALGHIYNCPYTSDATLKNIGNNSHALVITHMHILKPNI